MDRVNRKIRHKIMSANRSKNTSPEIIVRKALSKRGFRYKLHSNIVPGKPDIILSKYKAVIFIHGCFWHGHECKRHPKSKSNLSFWEDKISRNKSKDVAVRNALLNLGWRILIIWECAIRRQIPPFPQSYLLEKTTKWLRGHGRVAIITETGFDEIL